MVTGSPENTANKPLVLVTGAAGKIGTAVVRAIEKDYRVVGMDVSKQGAACDVIETDLTSPDAIKLAMGELVDTHGEEIASVIHLAAYFDFSGENSPAYDKVNVEGTRNLLRHDAGPSPRRTRRADHRKHPDRPEMGLSAVQGPHGKGHPRRTRRHPMCAAAPRRAL